MPTKAYTLAKIHLLSHKVHFCTLFEIYDNCFLPRNQGKTNHISHHHIPTKKDFQNHLEYPKSIFHRQVNQRDLGLIYGLEVSKIIFPPIIIRLKPTVVWNSEER